MFDMLNMLGKVKDIQAKIQQTKDKVALDVLSADAGDGKVNVTVNGKRQIVKITFESGIENASDAVVLAELVKEATNAALSKMDAHIAQELSKATEGLIPNMPGLDIKGLMGLK